MTRDGSVERVWAAITEPGQMLGWWAEAELDLRRGGSVVLRWQNTDDEGNQAVLHGEVTELDPPRLFEIAGDPHGTLRFELEPDGDACLLTFTNTVPAPGDVLPLALAGARAPRPPRAAPGRRPRGLGALGRAAQARLGAGPQALRGNLRCLSGAADTPDEPVRFGHRQSAQPKLRSTAFFHFAYCLSRSSSSIFGSHRLSSDQRSRSSSWSDQKPTARPAA